MNHIHVSAALITRTQNCHSELVSESTQQEMLNQVQHDSHLCHPELDSGSVTQIFTTQRGYGEWKDWWEFPGGKIEQDETPQAALVREIREELDTQIRVGEKLATVEYDYPTFHLTMECFWCEVVSGRLTLLEHENAKWLASEDLRSVKWLPADELILDKVEERLTVNN